MNIVEIGSFSRKLIVSAWPSLFWRRYRQMGQISGLDKLYLALSFDCDIAEDATVVLDVDIKLRKMGINPMYAVPGVLLEKNANVYLELLRRGAEFLNHGYSQHAFWNEITSCYESCFFYRHLSPDEIKNDILQGQQTVKNICGVSPKGFRTPHFGTFQGEKDLSFLHSFLAELGYVYSSSTMPLCSYKHGPAYYTCGLIEYPLSGSYSRPWTVQDSWSYFAAPDRKYGSSDYVTEAEAVTDYCRKKNVVGILNYYADPSQIWDKPEFFEAVRLWSEVAEPVQLRDLCCTLS